MSRESYQCLHCTYITVKWSPEINKINDRIWNVFYAILIMKEIKNDR